MKQYPLLLAGASLLALAPLSAPLTTPPAKAEAQPALSLWSGWDSWYTPQVRWDESTSPLTKDLVGRTLTLSLTPASGSAIDCSTPTLTVEDKSLPLPLTTLSCTTAKVSQTVTVTSSLVGHSLHLTGGSYLTVPTSKQATFTTTGSLLLGTTTTKASSTATRPSDAKAFPTKSFVTQGLPTVGLSATGTTASLEDSGSYGVVFLQVFNRNLIPAIKKTNPATQVFAYQNASAMSQGADNASNQTSVVEREWLSSHPEAYLHAPDGNLMHWADYSYLWPFNLGLPALQQEAIKKVTAEVKTSSWDGVLYDDVNQDFSSHAFRSNASFAQDSNLSSSLDVLPREWPQGDSSLANATAAFVHSVPGAVEAATGKPSFLNMQQKWNSWNDVAAWAGYSRGVMLEHAATWGEGTTTRTDADLFSTPDVQWRLNEMATLYQHGSYPVLVSYIRGDDLRAQRYHRALFLLGWNGREGLSMVQDYQGRKPAANTFLGTPLGSYQMSTGVYARRFSQGFVLMNTTLSPVTVDAKALGLSSITTPLTVGARDAYLGK